MELRAAIDLQDQLLGSLTEGELAPCKEEMASAYLATAPSRQARHALHAEAARTLATPPLGGIGIGLTLRKPHDIGLRVLLQVNSAEAWQAASYIGAQANGEADVEYVGLIGAHTQPHHRAPAWRRIMGVRPSRPLKPGMSVSHPRVAAGTIGAFVSQGDSPHAHVLSNNHVLANTDRASPADVILQPGRLDGGRLSRSRIGVLASAVPLGRAENIMDAALCALDEGRADYDWGPLASLAAPIDITPQMFEAEEIRVIKYGRTTGRTEGRIRDIRFSVDVSYGNYGVKKFVNQLTVESVDGYPFSDQGDSGALVIKADSSEPIGMVFAGNYHQQRRRPLSFVMPLKPVLSELNATLLP